MAVTCAYSLLEQAIKALLKRRGDPRADEGGRSGHRVDWLFRALPPEDKATVERGFASYLSLYDQIAASGATDILGRVGRSFNDWRYLLVERPRTGLSSIHPGALLEIARLAIEILANETFTNHGMHDVARRIADRIRLDGLDPALFERTLERHERGLPQEPVTSLDDWLRGIPNLLNGYASYLGGEIPESEL